MLPWCMTMALASHISNGHSGCDHIEQNTNGTWQDVTDIVSPCLVRIFPLVSDSLAQLARLCTRTPLASLLRPASHQPETEGIRRLRAAKVLACSLVEVVMVHVHRALLLRVCIGSTL
jgi:hypothetical protein